MSFALIVDYQFRFLFVPKHLVLLHPIFAILKFTSADIQRGNVFFCSTAVQSRDGVELGPSRPKSDFLELILLEKSG